MLGRAIPTVLRAVRRGLWGRKWREERGTRHGTKLWDRTEPSFCQGAEQSTVSVVCSQDFLWRSLHYCIQAKGRVKTDRRVVLEFS